MEEITKEACERMIIKTLKRSHWHYEMSRDQNEAQKSQQENYERTRTERSIAYGMYLMAIMFYPDMVWVDLVLRASEEEMKEDAD